ncbi:restriction endonuclease subunit S [Xanthomonas graminis]|uniref:Putative type I restriction and modification protein subunit S n=1 Tax=Xanthomonas graminis pv. graminis TaxID=134874 RepID=A0A1M4JAE8_9XANT|nr:restriction endonuclease subunit S [Xanthomonas translucens]EKU23902.1 hypothetical protein XTG29_03315 [Xanthomonas translucens pv. graminis ART-Xtg29]UKE55357.1 restriction endonuclease subunit S [Xanthomonas translucens pv. graminis]WIH09730.1 restriction endonuclease subunit S [Xanthomonas translucens pv. graminis]WIH11551.1 restriction endonuclease subunit S [Xanthomonas translucens pv. graminis]WIH15180.1 restriction endonuclease subunit S [Xanthomonas translucens pv. graminis]
MKEGQVPKAMPRLRFPGFCGVTSTFALSAVADLVNEKISANQISARQYVSTENLRPDFGGLSQAKKLPAVSSVTSFRPKDILISNIRPYLRKVWQSNMYGGASNDVLVFRSREHVDADYLAAILSSDLFIEYAMHGARGVKMPRGDILMINTFPVPCPESREQKKIYDCLSSLDDSIGAEIRKLDALKTHKQGLMQQLFPAEGQCLPRLRFPGFEHEWKEAKAGSLFSSRTEAGEDGLPIFAVTTNDGMVVRSSVERRVDDIVEAGANRKVCKGDIAYNMMRMWQGACGVAPEHCMVSPAYVVLAPQRGACSDFFGYLFKLPSTLRQLTSHSQGLTKDRLRLYYKDFASITMLCPTLAEQKMIAGCLSFVDKRIAIQARKVAMLHEHKKGLMHGLFPVGEAHAA